jgi:hypothetical protein
MRLEYANGRKTKREATKYFRSEPKLKVSVAISISKEKERKLPDPFY